MLTPEDITSRSFLVSLRGYDRDEVHAFLAQVADQVQELQERIDELEKAAAAVAAAPEAPAQPAAETAPQQAGAPTTPSDLFAEIGRETQRILEAAQSAGEDLRKGAKEEADRQLKAAKEEADRQLKAARAEATKTIAEGERRREGIEETVARLTAAREQLAGELRDVGRSVERTLRELIAEEEPTGTMREAVAASVRDDTEDVGDGGGDGDAPGGAPGDGDVPADTLTQDRPEEPPAGPDEPLTEEDIAEAADTAIDALAPEEPSESAEAEESAEESTEESAEAEERGAPDVGDEAQPEVGVQVVAAVADVEVVAVPGDEEAAEAPRGRAAEGEGPELDPAVLEEAQALRAQGLAPLHPKLVRKLKRGLQDLQNGMLDRLRRAEAKGEADDFLPDYSAISTLSALSEEFLVSAWWAGTASGEHLAAEEVQAPEPEGPLAEELTSALADRLLAELAQGLQEGLAAGEDIVGLGERIGSIFSAVKEAPVEELAALALLRTYEEGMHGAWLAGSVTHRHWALASEPPCTDPRCEENHRTGPVPLGTPFASGHDVPPVRVGCNCTTVPAIPRSEPAS